MTSTIDKTQRENLRRLIDTYYGGVNANLARHAEAARAQAEAEDPESNVPVVTESTLQRMLKGRKGVRNAHPISPASARFLESLQDLPAGWLDTPNVSAPNASLPLLTYEEARLVLLGHPAPVNAPPYFVAKPHLAPGRFVVRVNDPLLSGPDKGAVPPGSYVVFDPVTVEVEPGDIVIAALHDATIVRRYELSGTERWLVTARMQEQASRRVASDAELLGVARAVALVCELR